MAKVNFSKEHKERMEKLLLDMLMSNGIIQHKMIVLDVVNLLHTTTINTLNSIRLDISKKITELENADEWVSSSRDQERLEMFKSRKELVNLIIGYKRWQDEQESIKQARKLLMEELEDLKEAQKTPDDKIKELEEKLANLKEETL